MAPLSLGTGSHEVPGDFPKLMTMLGSRPQPAVVWYGSSGERVELSGRVLQNWAVKLIGLLREETDLDAEDHVLIDVAPHWKACAIALAAAALGCRVTLAHRRAAVPGQDLALVVTDRPHHWETSEALGDAELAALSPGLLDDSYAEAVGEDIPGWVLDVSADVRQHPDQLLEPLPQIPLPTLPSGSTAEDLRTRRDLLCAEPDHLAAVSGLAVGAAQDWTAWRTHPWGPEAPETMIHTWAHGGTTVVVDAATDQGTDDQGTDDQGELWETVLRNEGVG
ncbi:TIGR03089 family protein [Nesterenkonia suensis]